MIMKNTLKFASLLLSAAVLFSCEETNPETEVENGDGLIQDTESLVLASDKNVIQSNGQDAATLSVFTADGADVTAESTFYLITGYNSKNEPQFEELKLTDNKFTVTSTGEHKLMASYKALITESHLSINAIDTTVPSAVEDPQPSNTSFVHRTFLNQYTGTGCGYCPGMVRVLRETLVDEVADKAVLAAIHSYNSSDPAYLATPKASGYPFMHVDMVQSFSYDAGSPALAALINERIATPALVGISANPVYEKDRLVVRVSVKAAQTGNYNVGVWFLQDNVYGMQTDNLGITVGDDSYNNHNNCVRLADSKYMGSFVGYPLGEIKAGETAERTFLLNVNKRWKLTNLDDLHFAAFVTTIEGRGYKVVNVVDCPYNKPTPFDYTK